MSLEHYATFTGNASAQVLADALDAATGRCLDEGRSPSRMVGELDNRGCHYYLARYWAEALTAQDSDAALAQRFRAIAQRLVDDEDAIVTELAAVQGEPVDLGGYYLPDPAKAAAAMRPSPTLNAALATLT